MKASHEGGIRIVSLRAENYRRLKLAAVRIDAEAGLVPVVGYNGAGKSSLLRIVTDTLMGTREIDGTPIREGAETAMSGVDLSNGWSVERVYSEQYPKGKLTVVGVDGGKQNQTRLSELLGGASLDPQALFTMEASKRRDLFLSLSGDPDLVWTLGQLRARRDDIHEERTPFIVTLRGKSNLRPPAGERPEPVDVSAELARLGGLRAEQKARDEALRAAEDLAGRVADWDERITELEEQLRRARKHRDYAEAKRVEAVVEAEALPDRTAAIQAVESHIADANAVQAAIEPWIEYDRAAAKLAEAEAENGRLTAEIRAVDDEITALLAATTVPVPGMTFDADGTPLYHGRPEADWSGAERVEVAVAVGFATRPNLRVVLIDEASGLDRDALHRLDALAKERGFLILACRIEQPGEGVAHVVVEDGVAVNGAAESAEPEPAGASAP